MSGEDDALRANAERARLALNSIPWWRPFKRQDAADDYKHALLMGALWEIEHPPPDDSPAGKAGGTGDE